MCKLICLIWNIVGLLTCNISQNLYLAINNNAVSFYFSCNLNEQIPTHSYINHIHTKLSIWPGAFQKPSWWNRNRKYNSIFKWVHFHILLPPFYSKHHQRPLWVNGHKFIIHDRLWYVEIKLPLSQLTEVTQSVNRNKACLH